MKQGAKKTMERVLTRQTEDVYAEKKARKNQYKEDVKGHMDACLKGSRSSGKRTTAYQISSAAVPELRNGKVLEGPGSDSVERGDPNSAVTKKRKKFYYYRKAKNEIKFTVDCTLPAEDKIMNVADFHKYLQEHIKVNGKTNNFGEVVRLVRYKKTVSVRSDIPFSKRYLKYLIKKYLKKNNLRDWLRVVAREKDTYELRYFEIDSEENEEDEDSD
jgi:large subunit ribosomal protein L22e